MWSDALYDGDWREIYRPTSPSWNLETRRNAKCIPTGWPNKTTRV